MLKIQPGNKALTDGQTDRQMDGWTLKHFFFSEGIT